MQGNFTRRRVMVGVAAVAATPSFAQATQPVVHDIRIEAFTFEPSTVTAKVGDILRWTNADLAPHTATADEFGWDTGSLARGDMAEIVVTAEMETTYFCVFHPHMKGQIIIK